MLDYTIRRNRLFASQLRKSCNMGVDAVYKSDVSANKEEGTSRHRNIHTPVIPAL
jgi:hypothetical protein